MGKQISTSSTAIGYYSKNWVESKIESTEDLIKVVKTKAYSNAIFKDGKRAGKNIIGFHDLLILDIDNDDTDFTIENCKDLFTSNNIASLIIPSRSNRKAKNGIIRDRYRVICHFDKVISFDISKEVYTTMMELIVKDLHMEQYVDKKALKDFARYYYPSRNLDETLIRETTGKKIVLDKYLKKATLDTNMKGLVKKVSIMRKKYNASAKRKRNAVINKKNITSGSKPQVKSNTSAQSSNTGDYFVYDKIYKYDIVEIANNIDFRDLISDYETITLEEPNSNGIKIKTADKNTYQFFDDTGILCDLKKDNMSYNLYSYIKSHFQCNSIEVLQHMDKYTDIATYRYINEDWQYAIVKSLDISTNRREFEANLRTELKFDKLSIMKDQEDVLIVYGKKVNISEFELQDYQSKYDIVKKFQENRKKLCSKNP